MAAVCGVLVVVLFQREGWGGGRWYIAPAVFCWGPAAGAAGTGRHRAPPGAEGPGPPMGCGSARSPRGAGRPLAAARRVSAVRAARRQGVVSRQTREVREKVIKSCQRQLSVPGP